MWLAVFVPVSGVSISNLSMKGNRENLIKESNLFIYHYFEIKRDADVQAKF